MIRDHSASAHYNAFAVFVPGSGNEVISVKRRAQLVKQPDKTVLSAYGLITHRPCSASRHLQELVRVPPAQIPQVGWQTVWSDEETKDIA